MSCAEHEQGQVRVVKAGPVFELLAVNAVDDYVMATPAISNGSLFVRSQHYLLSLGKKVNGKANGRPRVSGLIWHREDLVERISNPSYGYLRCWTFRRIRELFVPF